MIGLRSDKNDHDQNLNHDLHPPSSPWPGRTAWPTSSSATAPTSRPPFPTVVADVVKLSAGPLLPNPPSQRARNFSVGSGSGSGSATLLQVLEPDESHPQVVQGCGGEVQWVCGEPLPSLSS